MKVEAEEVFGPVVTVKPFKSTDELLPSADDSHYGLAAGVWTNDIKKAHRTAAELMAGTVWINCYVVFDAALPFGGYKESGWGREMGQDALELYAEVRAVCAALSHCFVRGGGGRPSCVLGVSWRSWQAVTAMRRPGREECVGHRAQGRHEVGLP